MSDKFNFSRKLFHISGIIVIAVFFLDALDNIGIDIFVDNTRSFIFLMLLLSIFVMYLVEFLRFRNDKIQELFFKLVGGLLKSHEKEKVHGSVPFFIGMAIAFGFFPKQIAVLSIIFLITGDPSAAYFGGKYGKRRFKNGKSVIGTASGIAACFLVGVIFLIINGMIFPDSHYVLTQNGNLQYSMLIMLLAGSTVAMVSELFSSHGFFDDNLLIPVLSGLFMIFFMFLIKDLNFNDLVFPLSKLIIPK